MPQGTYIPPKLNERRFTCPLCHTLTSQKWEISRNSNNSWFNVNECHVWVSECSYCNDTCLWIGEQMVYPDTGDAPPPNGDLPPKVKKIYREAASIMQKSPRAAAGLLRLAIETLCIELKCEGRSLQDKINSLVKKDSNLQEIVEVLDIVRLVGNASVHAGTIEINDNRNIVKGMFKLINFAAERLITGPKEVASIVGEVTKKLSEESKKQKSELGRE